MAVEFVPSLERGRSRSELLNQYLRLQHELVDGDPASASYQPVVHAFRQLGASLISAGYEEDLDRLLRIRVLEGGRPKDAPRTAGPPRLLRVVPEQSSA